ncbi:MAG TPA: response regulator transcription factor [Pseudobacteroides sp.]|uniref:response regulator transcription factor n=1 Tax=Pseudobacteroides sp. TaxID=1968840 RepID=UPI002F9321A9
MKLLIVDDEKPLIIGLTTSLKKEGYEVYSAYDGLNALELIKTIKPDMAILDVMLPEMDGITLLKKLREFSDIPVIMLTAKDDYADMVLGLELGADDYVTKPFNTRVLVARIKAVTRRKSQNQELSQFSFRDLTIDFDLRTVYKKQQEIPLTSKEFDILSALARNKGRVIPRDLLYEMVWNTPDYDTRTVDVHVSKLREKIENDPSNPCYIKTKWGVGYYFVKEA